MLQRAIVAVCFVEQCTRYDQRRLAPQLHVLARVAQRLRKLVGAEFALDQCLKLRPTTEQNDAYALG